MVKNDHPPHLYPNRASGTERIAARFLRYAVIATVQLLLIAFLLLPGVLAHPFVDRDRWPRLDYSWNVLFVAAVADVVICLLVVLISRANVRRVCVSTASSILPLLFVVLVLAPYINSAESIGDPYAKLLACSSLGVVVGWIIGGFINGQFDNPAPFRLPPIQFTLSDLLLLTLVVACVVGFLSFLVWLRNG